MQKKLDKTLLQVVQILNKHKINYWICHGTLLGLVRDKKIISNTSDIDIGIWKNDYDKKNISSIRKNLLEENIILEDSKEGTFWRRR